METQPAIAVVLEHLRAFRKAANLTPSALALKAGLSRAALVGIDDKDWSPSRATIEAIEKLIPKDWRAGDPLPDKARARRALRDTRVGRAAA